MKKSGYTFLWGDYQPLHTIETNINGFIMFRQHPWNRSDNIIEVSRKGMIQCYHSTRDLDNDVERGRLYFDQRAAVQLLRDVERACARHQSLFRALAQLPVSRLSDAMLLEHLARAFRQWTETISYFRMTQQEGTQYLVAELKKRLSDKDAALLMQPHDLDVANKELLDWQKLIKLTYAEKRMLQHARKYPYIAVSHFSYRDVIGTLRQKYHYDRIHLVPKNIVKEKRDLWKRQKAILGKNPALQQVAHLLQKLAVSRMQVKSCWAGNDFFIIPIMAEIAKRSSEPVQDLYRYYLMAEIRELLRGKRLSAQEKSKRDQCFVGLWKDKKARYVSGPAAERLARRELGSLYEVKRTKEIAGVAANPGYAKGVARILQTNNVEQTNGLRKTFQNGEILVTQMTQPNVMDIASRAAALVTDEGGMLSHAAIISREFRIPCVVGTHKATQVIQEGEWIEVDADKGLVRILQRRR